MAFLTLWTGHGSRQTSKVARETDMIAVDRMPWPNVDGRVRPAAMHDVVACTLCTSQKHRATFDHFFYFSSVTKARGPDDVAFYFIFKS